MCRALGTQPRRCRVLSGSGNCSHPSCLCSPSSETGTGLRAGKVTAGLAESNGSLPPGLWLTSSAGWLPTTGINSGTLCSVIEHGLPLPLLYWHNPRRPVPEESFTRWHSSWSSDILYQLPPFNYDPQHPPCSIYVQQSCEYLVGPVFKTSFKTPRKILGKWPNLRRS